MKTKLLGLLFVLATIGYLTVPTGKNESSTNASIPRDIRSPFFDDALSPIAYRHNSTGNVAPELVGAQNNVSVFFLVCSSPALPVCSLAIFCSFNVGACSEAGVCSLNAGACSVAAVCSVNLGVCSAAGACSLNGGGCSVVAAACSVVNVGVCTAGGVAVCSVNLGVCSISVGDCSVNIGGCSVSRDDCSVNFGPCSRAADNCDGTPAPVEEQPPQGIADRSYLKSPIQGDFLKFASK